MKTLIKVSFVALVLMLLTAPLLACGGAAPSPSPTPAPKPTPSPTPSPTPTTPAPPGANRPPQIVALKAEPGAINPGQSSTVTCQATDPDGDTLSYNWTVSGGTFSKLAASISWQSPNTDGDYVISVTVSDGKGGTATEKVAVVVGKPLRTLTLQPVAAESGSVHSTGDLTSSWQIGDKAANNGVQAFFSFDLSGLSQAEIKEAKLKFNVQQEVGKPWLISAYLYIEQVDYGSRPLQGADFDIAGFELVKTTSSVPGEVDVTLPIERLLRPPVKHRLQVRLRLGQVSNVNSQDDYISLSGAVINLTYTVKQ